MALTMWNISLLFLSCAGWTIAQVNDTKAAVDNPCAAISKLYEESTGNTLTDEKFDTPSGRNFN